MRKSNALNPMLKIIFTGIFCAISFVSSGQSFIHPGILNNKTELDFIKSKIKEGQEPWKTAFVKLKTSSYSSLNYKSQPFAIVECGSYNNPNIGCNNIVDDGMAVYSLSLMWYFSDSIQYANKAIEIINAWSDVYQQNTNSNARLVVSWATPWYVNGAEILRYSNAGFKDSDIAKFNTLLDKFLPYTLDETMSGNNWIQSAIEAHIAIAVFKNDRVLFTKAVDRWKVRVKTYIYQDTDGPKPVSIPNKTETQTETIWRSTATSTAYINGLAMETCRDLGHLGLGYNSMIYAAETAWKQGIDLFSGEKKRLSDFMELHGSWMTGAVAVPANICDGKVIAGASDANGIKPPTGGGKTCWEIAYLHLHKRLGIDLPYTKQMILITRPKTAYHWVSKWETLTHGSQFDVSDIDQIYQPSDNKSCNKVYPNPAKRNLYIETIDSGMSNFQVLSPSGQIILKGNFEGKTEVDMTNYSHNFNLVRVLTNTGVSNHKIFIN